MFAEEAAAMRSHAAAALTPKDMVLPQSEASMLPPSSIKDADIIEHPHAHRGSYDVRDMEHENKLSSHPAALEGIVSFPVSAKRQSEELQSTLTAYHQLSP